MLKQTSLVNGTKIQHHTTHKVFYLVDSTSHHSNNFEHRWMNEEESRWWRRWWSRRIAKNVSIRNSSLLLRHHTLSHALLFFPYHKKEEENLGSEWRKKNSRLSIFSPLLVCNKVKQIHPRYFKYKIIQCLLSIRWVVQSECVYLSVERRRKAAASNFSEKRAALNENESSRESLTSPLSILDGRKVKKQRKKEEKMKLLNANFCLRRERWHKTWLKFLPTMLVCFPFSSSSMNWIFREGKKIDENISCHRCIMSHWRAWWSAVDVENVWVSTPSFKPILQLTKIGFTAESEEILSTRMWRKCTFFLSILHSNCRIVVAFMQHNRAKFQWKCLWLFFLIIEVERRKFMALHFVLLNVVTKDFNFSQLPMFLRFRVSLFIQFPNFSLHLTNWRLGKLKSLTFPSFNFCIIENV